MHTTLRLFMLAGSLFILFFIARKIQKSQIKIADSIFWMLFSIALILFAIFPGLADALSGFFGFIATSNFVFSFVVGIILIKVFNNSREISQLNNKIEMLTQEMALKDLQYRNQIAQAKFKDEEIDKMISAEE